MKDVIIQDYPDTVGFEFETPSPSTPADMIHEIIDLARQCYEQRKAFVSVNIFGGSHSVLVLITEDIAVHNYESLNKYSLTPKKFDALEELSCSGDDAMYLMGIVLKLQAIVGGA